MLSRRCTYGLQAALYLAAQPGEGFIAIREVSEGLGLSQAFLTKVLQHLTRCGLMTSLRGPNGGVALARPAEEIRLLDVVLALDGERRLAACLLGLPGCGTDRPCLLHDRWCPLRSSLHDVLAATTVADLAGRAAAVGLWHEEDQ
jgi:Rrf2 family iron-sulfur cluster assembly transcriptional regulator